MKGTLPNGLVFVPQWWLHFSAGGKHTPVSMPRSVPVGLHASLEVPLLLSVGKERKTERSGKGEALVESCAGKAQEASS